MTLLSPRPHYIPLKSNYENGLTQRDQEYLEGIRNNKDFYLDTVEDCFIFIRSHSNASKELLTSAFNKALHSIYNTSQEEQD